VATLKKYDLTGKEIGKATVDDKLLKSANSQMIKDYIVAIRKNARQWSANTKGRSEVKATTKKPHAQKGLGRARQGSFAAPQYKGGGIVFGPKPKKNMHTRINQKERNAAVVSILSDKIKSGNVHVLDCDTIETPKTKLIANFLAASKLEKKRVLCVGDTADQNVSHTGLIKSLRNIPKTEFMRSVNLNGYDVSLAAEVVVLDSAFDEFVALLGK